MLCCCSCSACHAEEACQPAAMDAGSSHNCLQVLVRRPTGRTVGSTPACGRAWSPEAGHSADQACVHLAARLPAGTTLYNDPACTSAVGTATGDGPVINPTTPSAFTPVGSPVPSGNVVKSPAASEPRSEMKSPYALSSCASTVLRWAVALSCTQPRKAHETRSCMMWDVRLFHERACFKRMPL